MIRTKRLLELIVDFSEVESSLFLFASKTSFKITSAPCALHCNARDLPISIASFGSPERNPFTTLEPSMLNTIPFKRSFPSENSEVTPTGT
jgi:hypothetical protein